MTERIKQLQEQCKKRGEAGFPCHFQADLHESALGRFASLPHREKLARAMGYAIENMDVFAYEDDRIGGRNYFYCEEKVEESCSELDCDTPANEAFRRICPDADVLQRNKLIHISVKGHISWRYDRILELGVSGFKTQVEGYLSAAKDAEAKEFYEGVLILLDAMLAFNDKHIAAYEQLGNFELAERMKRVPRYPAESFRDAVQAYFMQHIVVMRENPYGGNSPGRLDYYLWPYLKKDLEKGVCTLEEAREIIDELFLRIDERIHNKDGWAETIVVGGTAPDGSSAINPLTYIMVRSLMDLNITHPLVYIRLPKDPPKEILDLCVDYLMAGNNRAQILSDPPIMEALMNVGVPYEDAVDYFCGGCMEIGVQGKNSDLLYVGWVNTAKMLELMITGGVCLKTGEKLPCFQSEKGLAGYSDFERFYVDFLKEAKRLIHLGLRYQDYCSYYAEKNRPAYLLSSMMDDCLARGRNMHGGGARYHDYGGTPLALPNTIDSLLAIKLAVFEQRLCSAEELIAALKGDYKGYEVLQLRLKQLPKYGMDNDEADAFAARVMQDFTEMYHSFTTRHGGKGKPIILTFTYAPEAAAALGARADGNNAGATVAHGITPQALAMTKGITAAINSVGKIPHEIFSGGASTMWDFDSSWVNEDVIRAVLCTFIEKGGQIFQGNTTSVEDLVKAKDDPDHYRHLIVRVGGYSARFVNLKRALQDEIIGRIRHKG
ncbi:MAG: pyruvate formate lyase family protein [Clostridia bacterium]|nr:pyruvate formate lyase family protein [Clostridia bacterium]